MITSRTNAKRGHGRAEDLSIKGDVSRAQEDRSAFWPRIFPIQARCSGMISPRILAEIHALNQAVMAKLAAPQSGLVQPSCVVLRTQGQVASLAETSSDGAARKPPEHVHEDFADFARLDQTRGGR
jgi:hypothetical protein